MAKTEMKPTKEEILERNIREYRNGKHESSSLTFANALKAMDEYAEQFHKEKLREELLEYENWYFTIPTKDFWNKSAAQCIDEYLKTKQ